MSALKPTARCSRSIGFAIMQFALSALAMLALNAGCSRQPAGGPLPTASVTSSPAAVTVTPALSPPATQHPSAVPVATPSPLSAPGLTDLINLGGPAFYGRNPLALAVLRDTAYVANEGSRNLSIVRDGRVVGAISLDAGPYDVVSDPAGGRVFVAAESAQSILVVKEETIMGNWPLAAAPTAITLVGDGLWVGTTDGSIVRLDARTGQVLSRSDPTPDGMIVDLVTLQSGHVLAATFSSVHLFEPTGTSPIASVPFPGLRAVAASGEAILVCSYDVTQGGSAVHVLDTALQVQSTLTVPEDTVSIAGAPGRGSLFVVGNTTHRVSRLNLAAGKVVAESTAGLAPQRVVYDPVADRLYVTGFESDTLAILEGDSLSRIAMVPLTLRVTSLVPGHDGTALYVGLNTGEVRILDADGERPYIQDAGYPVALAALPDDSSLAVLDRASARATLYDASGKPIRSVQTSAGPQGLYADVTSRTLFAGDVAISFDSDASWSVRVPAGDSTLAPVQILRDTRRDQLYAVALNGQPGSGGGYVIYRQAGAEWLDTSTPGQLSVIELAYDATMDRFFSTSGRMGDYVLQAYAAGPINLLAELRLAGPPNALLLSDRYHHLWVATGASEDATSGAYTLVTAYDTRVLAPVATIRINDTIGSAAVDSQSGRLYLAATGGAMIYVVQDAVLPEPTAAVRSEPVQPAMPTPAVEVSPTPPALSTSPAPAGTPWPTPAATRVLTPRASLTPAPTVTVLPECEIPVAEALSAAWKLSSGRLGCPTLAAMRENWGLQPFERGTAYWRRDTRQILAALNTGTVLFFEDRWQEGMPEQACQAEPPAGFWQPIRGFGLVWCNHTEVREGLGWALQPEAAILTTYQLFSRGILFTSGAQGTIWIANDGTWTLLAP